MQHEHEDLLRDGRNMPVRAATMIGKTRVIIGFRSNGQVSIYCGQDPVFQFNADKEIRRVYFRGERYAANGRALCRLKSIDNSAKLTFQSEPASPDVVDQIFREFDQWRLQIIESTNWEFADRSESDFATRLRTWIETLPQRPVIAIEPNA